MAHTYTHKTHGHHDLETKSAHLAVLMKMLIALVFDEGVIKLFLKDIVDTVFFGQFGIYITNSEN